MDQARIYEKMAALGPIENLFGPDDALTFLRKATEGSVKTCLDGVHLGFAKWTRIHATFGSLS